MKLVSQSEFAKLAGISRQAVYDAIKRDAIIITTQGKKKYIDIDDKTNKYYLEHNDNGQRKKKDPSKSQKKKETIKNPKTPAEKKEIFTGKVLLPDTESDDEPESSEYDKYKLQCRKLEKETQRIEIITAEKRQELVSREKVALIFAKLHNIDSRELLQLPAKTAPEISALIGADDPKIQIGIEKLLEQEIYATIDRAKQLLIDELREMKTEFVEEVTA